MDIHRPSYQASYQVILNLERVITAMETVFAAALLPFGLSPAQWDILRQLRERPGASGAEIARLAKVTPQAIATMLQRLEKAGLITRQESATGRVVQTYLTAQGEALLKKGDCIAAQIQAQVLSTLTLAEQQIFDQALLKCIESLEAVEAAGGLPQLES